MTITENPVFEETYTYYQEQLRQVALADVAAKLGGRFDQGKLAIELYDRPYIVSSNGITGPDGGRPKIDICVILSKYILRCPQTAPQERQWVSFKDFRDAGPLISYFSKDVEGALAGYYAGRLEALKAAAQALNAKTPDLEVNYDLALEFSALPQIPIVFLFNDADEEFAASSAVLFQRRTEIYLDAECIAMLGWRLLRELKKSG